MIPPSGFAKLKLREILLVKDVIGEIEGFGRRLQHVYLRS